MLWGQSVCLRGLPARIQGKFWLELEHVCRQHAFGGIHLLNHPPYHTRPTSPPGSVDVKAL